MARTVVGAQRVDEHTLNGIALVVGRLLGAAKLGEEGGVTTRQFFYDNGTGFR
ncbi:hypothetical protein MGAST_11000 [Mycobacterium gastri 'Wayne']|nr:hypothetical protein MGAST_11000 [Mycobacterium gastri 'Wayne']